MLNTNSQMVIKAFDDLTPIEIFNIYQARMAVFIIEQTCLYQDIDAADLVSDHIMMRQDKAMCGYCRIIPPATNTQRNTSLVAIGRVLIVKHYRGQGLSRKLMQYAIDYCNAHYGSKGIYISAQTYLRPFYESLGFIAQGEAYLEDGIEHIAMIWRSQT